MKTFLIRRRESYCCILGQCLYISNSTRCAGVGKSLGTVQVAGCNSDSTARFVDLITEYDNGGQSCCEQ